MSVSVFLRRHIHPWWSKSYLVDYATIVVLWLVVFFVMKTSGIKPFCRYYVNTDGATEECGPGDNDCQYYSPIASQISHPFKDNTVPSWTLPVIGLLCPVAVFGFSQLFLKSFHDFHSAFLSVIQAETFQYLLVEPIKVAVGRQRPDWLNRLRHLGFSEEQIVDPFSLCDNTNSVLLDGRKSFVSGHSSWAFAGMTVLSLYIFAKLGVFSNQNTGLFGRGGGASTWKIIIGLVPLGCAGAVAISRLTDYRHDYSDVLGGSLLGIFCGCLGYYPNYPGLWSESAQLPYNRVLSESKSQPRRNTIQDGNILEAQYGCPEYGEEALDASMQSLEELNCRTPDI
eukprot:Nk52_evm10s1020 gene=Nk52_evmTU10s1020